MTFIGLLRGINVSGKNVIKMANLREWLESSGLKNVETYIQSGNLIFDSNKKPEALEKLIFKTINKQTGFEVPVLVRDLPFLQKAIAGSPFAKEKIESLATMVLSAVPERSLVNALKAMDFGDDQFAIKKDVVSLFIPNGFGKTKLTNVFFEKKLDVSATTRNWKTMAKLIEMAKR